MIYGYCRATTEKQIEEGFIDDQINSIKERYFDCSIFVEESLSLKSKKVFDELNSKLEKDDILVVTTMDRFAKSIDDVCSIIMDFKSRGVKLHILNIGLIDESMLGTIIYDTIKSIGDFNKALLVERIQSGKNKAKKTEGFKEGRPKKYSDEKIEEALNLLNKFSYKRVEEMTGISKSTLIRAKKQKQIK